MNVIHSNGTVDAAPSALVVGAGVAGCAVAAGLRARGWNVRLIERAASLRVGGYKVDARGAAVEVLRRLGVLESARARATRVRTGSVVAPDGSLIAAMGGDTFGGRTTDDLEIERGDLVELLAEAAGEVEFGRTVTALEQRADAVVARFDDGTSAAFDVVLGADGVHSTVRRLAIAPPAAPAGRAVADATDPAERSLGHAIAVATMPTSMGLGPEEMTCVAPGATVLVYATATRPRARALFLFAHGAGDSPHAPLPRDRAGAIALLRDRFAGHGWRVPELLAALDEADDVSLDELSQVRLPSWSAGRIGLVGDAACAPSAASGQGTTVALVSACVVAEALVASPDDVAGALAASDQHLRPFAERNQAMAHANLPRMVLRTRAAVRSTLLALRILSRLPFSDRLLSVVARRLDAASAFDLPEPLPETARRDYRSAARSIGSTSAPNTGRSRR